VLRQLGKEVQGVEHVKVFLEVLRVGRVKEDPPFERLVADLLQEIGGRAMYSARLSWEDWSRMRTLLSMLKPECFQDRRLRAKSSFRSLRCTTA
jgi:hypothetical protein